MRRNLVAALILLFLPMFAQALPAQRDLVPARHYILESAVPLDADPSAELAAQGGSIPRFRSRLTRPFQVTIRPPARRSSTISTSASSIPPERPCSRTYST